MIISSNELHPIKAFFSIFLTEYGTTIFLRLMQFSNAPAPISLTVPFLISTETSLSWSLNAPSPIRFTSSGIFTLSGFSDILTSVPEFITAPLRPFSL